MAATTGKKGSKISFSDTFAKSLNEKIEIPEPVEKQEEGLVPDIQEEVVIVSEQKEEKSTSVKNEEVSYPAIAEEPTLVPKTVADIFSKQKKETYSVHKALLVKPSTMNKLQKILDERELSFNFVVNKLLEMFIQDAEAADVSFREDK